MCAGARAGDNREGERGERRRRRQGDACCCALLHPVSELLLVVIMVVMLVPRNSGLDSTANACAGCADGCKRRIWPQACSLSLFCWLQKAPAHLDSTLIVSDGGPQS